MRQKGTVTQVVVQTTVKGASAQQIKAGLDSDGYCIVERFLSSDEAAAKRLELTRILEATPTGRNSFEGHTTKRVYNLFAKTRSFDALAIHPLVLEVLDSALGSYQLSAPTGIEIGPGEKAQAIHRDDAIYPIRRPHQELVLNTMWALDDFTEENGATHVIPGSQRWIDQQPDESTATVRAIMPAGSVMFFLGGVLHGGGANLSDRPRLGVILEYAAGWLRQQENHVIGVPREVVGTLPVRLQELLGYNIHPPFVGYVDGVHPRKFL